ncbi:MAG: hypothetical protein AB7O93_19605 [Vicinamibacterales bacterium]
MAAAGRAAERMVSWTAGLLGLGAALGTPAGAQVLGTFSWQLQPYCNVVTVQITQQGALYGLDGFDDQCGAGQRATLVGTATPNPDGTIGFGLHLVTAPGGRGLDIDARISPATLGGPWTDGAGHSGTFAFGAHTGGSPRPAPPAPGGGLTAGSVMAVHLAAGAVTSAALAPAAVGAAQINQSQVQARVAGTCPKGQALRGVNGNGTVVCSDALTSVASGTEAAVAIGSDGLPIVAFRKEGSQVLGVVHCGNPACTLGNDIVFPPAGNSGGNQPSIAIGADGFPLISHLDDVALTLLVTHCQNVRCTASTTTTPDLSTNSVGGYSSIAIGTDGLPIISYNDFTALAGTLRVTHCGNTACTGRNTSTTVDAPATGKSGYYTSIAIGTDGLPIISHELVTGTVGALRVTHCGNILCSAGNISTTVDNPGTHAGTETSLAIGADGRPIVVHGDESPWALRVTHCTDVPCTSATTTVMPDARLPAIVIGPDGLPLISAQDTQLWALRVTHCGNVTCTAGNVGSLVDDASFETGYTPSIAVAPDGLPIVAYHDLAHEVRAAKCGTATCQ